MQQQQNAGESGVARAAAVMMAHASARHGEGWPVVVLEAESFPEWLNRRERKGKSGAAPLKYTADWFSGANGRESSEIVVLGRIDPEQCVQLVRAAAKAGYPAGAVWTGRDEIVTIDPDGTTSGTSAADPQTLVKAMERTLRPERLPANAKLVALRYTATSWGDHMLHQSLMATAGVERPSSRRGKARRASRGS